MIRSISTALLLLFAWCSSTHAQEEDQLLRAELANQRISDLRQGQLIVVLPSQSNKIEVLERMLDDPDLSPKKKKRLIASRNSAYVERARVLNEYVTGFNENYSFSKYLYLTADKIRTFQADPMRSVFFNPERDSVALDLDLPYFYLIQERLSAENNTNSTVWQFQDKDFNPLSKPFPNNFLINVGAFEKNPATVFMKINNKLLHYYGENVDRQPSASQAPSQNSNPQNDE